MSPAPRSSHPPSHLPREHLGLQPFPTKPPALGSPPAPQRSPLSLQPCLPITQKPGLATTSSPGEGQLPPKALSPSISYAPGASNLCCAQPEAVRGLLLPPRLCPPPPGDSQRTGGTITSNVCAWKNTAFGDTFAAPDRQQGPFPLLHLPGHKTPPPRRPTKAWSAPELVRDPPCIPPAPGEGGQGTAGHCHVPTGRASLAEQGQESRGSLQGQRALPSHPPHAAFSRALPREEVRMPRAPQICRKRLVSPTAGPTLAPAWHWGPRVRQTTGLDLSLARCWLPHPGTGSNPGEGARARPSISALRS